MNVMRKIYGKSKAKPTINIVDLTKRPELLEVLTDIREMQLESTL
jgi:hypothetical protein